VADLTLTLQVGAADVNGEALPGPAEVIVDMSFGQARELFTQLAEAIGEDAVAEALGFDDNVRAYLSDLLARDARRIRAELLGDDVPPHPRHG